VRNPNISAKRRVRCVEFVRARTFAEHFGVRWREFFFGCWVGNFFCFLVLSFFFFGVVSDYFFPAVFVVGGGRVFLGAG